MIGRGLRIVAHARLSAALLLPALLLAACGAGSGNESGAERPSARATPSVGASGEVEDAAYVAYERVTLERLPRARLEPEGEVRLADVARRLPAFRLRDGGPSAIRYTDDHGAGWLAWEPTVTLRARQEFARAEGKSAGGIVTLDVRRVDWPDTCLGVPRPAESPGACRPDPTPGFQVTLRLGGTTAVYHTDRADRVARAS